MSSSPPQHVADIVANANVFAGKWGWWPMQSWLEEFRALGLVRRGIDGRWQVSDDAPTGPLEPATGPLTIATG